MLNCPHLSFCFLADRRHNRIQMRAMTIMLANTPHVIPMIFNSSAVSAVMTSVSVLGVSEAEE